MTFAFLFFDSVGGGEWLVLLAVILIVVGPKNLPSAARKVGQILAQLRRAADEFKRQIMTMDQEMERAVNEVKKDYVDVAQDIDRTVTEDNTSATSETTDHYGADGDLGDGDDRAYDYYDESYGGVSPDEGPTMAENPPEPTKTVPTEAELKQVKISVTTAAERGAKT